MLSISFQKMLLAGLLLTTACFPNKKQAVENEPKSQFKKLVWSDEFDGTGLPDPTKWGYDVGDGCPNVCGWGNNELQFYTEKTLKNARQQDGRLIIEAHREPMGGKNFTSARLVSKHHGDWLYGRIEVRARVPDGRGTWPAIWMLSTDWRYGGWPASGEIDIMEHVGHKNDSIFGSAHTEHFNHVRRTQPTRGVFLKNPQLDFHIYAIEWTAEKIDFSVDRQQYLTFRNDGRGWESWPFDQRFHLILNVAVGGNWGGEQGVDDSIWPRRMEVDWVRVFQ